MYKYRFLLFAVAAVLPAAAVANDAALQCTLLQDNALRLACYDKVFAAQLPPEQPLSEHEADGKPQLDVVQSVRQSIGNKETTLVFDTPEGQAEPSQELADAAAAYTPLSQMYDLDANDPHGILTVREHNPMYLMPVWYNSSPNYAPSSPTRGGGFARTVFGSKTDRNQNAGFFQEQNCRRFV